MRRSCRFAIAVAALVASASLSGCTPTLSLPPAPDANNPLCAEVTVLLPDAIADQLRRTTDAQATGAWGDQAVILACGYPPPAPTAELPCMTVDEVDWLVDTQHAPNLRLLTYGREPAVQVWVRSDVVSSNVALTALAPAVSQLPASGNCIGLSQSTG
jgi:hypothetical protein